MRNAKSERAEERKGNETEGKKEKNCGNRLGELAKEFKRVSVKVSNSLKEVIEE